MIEDIYEFYTGHAIEFLSISRRTIYRWLKSGKITSFKDISGNHKFTLREINRVLELQGQNPLTKEDAYNKWESLYGSK